eukprot:134945-Pyramimonas_sp.AAC.1
MPEVRANHANTSSPAGAAGMQSGVVGGLRWPGCLLTLQASTRRKWRAGACRIAHGGGAYGGVQCRIASGGVQCRIASGGVQCRIASGGVQCRIAYGVVQDLLIGGYVIGGCLRVQRQCGSKCGPKREPATRINKANN